MSASDRALTRFQSVCDLLEVVLFFIPALGGGGSSLKLSAAPLIRLQGLFDLDGFHVRLERLVEPAPFAKDVDASVAPYSRNLAELFFHFVQGYAFPFPGTLYHVPEFFGSL